jgi:hypothetical protein
VPLSAANRVQANSATEGTPVSPVSSITPTLTGGDTTSDQSTVLAFHSTASVITTPGDWVLDQQSTALLYAFRRPAVVAGESSWPFTISASYSLWRVEEWTGIDLIDPLVATALGTIQAASATTPSGTTGDPGVDDFAAIAVFLFAKGSAGQGAFPADRSYSNGFTEVAYHTFGTGNAAGDRALAIAESYPGVAGALETTMTLSTAGGGSLTGLTSQGMMLAYRAVGEEIIAGPTMASGAPPP